MKTPRTFTIVEWTALGIVGGMSLLNIALKILGGWDNSFILSLVGLLYCLFFWSNKKKLYIPLLFIWALAQTIEINYVTATTVFNLDQVLSYGFLFTFSTQTSATGVGVGFAGIAYTTLAILVQMDSIRGSVFSLKSLKRDSVLTEFLPADVKIIKRITIGDEKSWFLVSVENKTPEMFALIRGKEEKVIRRGKNQIVHCYKADDPQWLLNASSINRNVLRSGGWAVVV